jgi:transaldolase
VKFFIDTANIREIQEGIRMGMVDGVTTNPTLIARENRPAVAVIREILDTVEGPVSLAVLSVVADEMVEEGKRLARLGPNVVVKVPITVEGLKATRIFAEEGIRVNQTLVFSPIQALMAAKAGATYVSPFVGRLDDIAHRGMEIVEQMISIYDNYRFDTEIIVASIRHPRHVLEAALMGADVATIPFTVLLQLARHPLTDKGVDAFLADWQKIPVS